MTTLPPATRPQEPEKTANDGGPTERSTTMRTTTSSPEWLEERFEEGSEDEYWERVAIIGTVVGGEWTAETIKGIDGATKVAVQTQGDVHGDGSDLMDDGVRLEIDTDFCNLHFLSAQAARDLARLLNEAADLLDQVTR